MQTQVIEESAPAIPWLEPRTSDGSLPQRTLITSFPFSIGRGDTVDLQVNSTRVSRVHATLLNDEGGCQIRDLGSTNGTMVNGKRIQCAPIADGDVLTLADVEIVFHLQPGDPPRNATQVMSEDAPLPAADMDATELIDGIRGLQELTIHPYVRSLFQPVVLLDDESPYGFESMYAFQVDDLDSRETERLVNKARCPLAQRLRHVYRQSAVEEHLERCSPLQIFLSFATWELERDDVEDEIRMLCEVAPDPGRIVVGVPASVILELPTFRRIYEEIRSLGARIAYADVSMKERFVQDMSHVPGDYVKLSDTAIRHVDSLTERQDRLRSLIEASRDIRSEVIASGIHNKNEAKVCHELGCRFGQGDYFNHDGPRRN